MKINWRLIGAIIFTLLAYLYFYSSEQIINNPYIPSEAMGMAFGVSLMASLFFGVMAFILLFKGFEKIK